MKVLKIKKDNLKNIKVEDDLWEGLMNLKIEMRKKTVSEVIRYLLEKSKK